MVLVVMAIVGAQVVPDFSAAAVPLNYILQLAASVIILHIIIGLVKNILDSASTTGQVQRPATPRIKLPLPSFIILSGLAILFVGVTAMRSPFLLFDAVIPVSLLGCITYWATRLWGFGRHRPNRRRKS
jgi:hypothetical protein